VPKVLTYVDRFLALQKTLEQLDDRISGLEERLDELKCHRALREAEMEDLRRVCAGLDVVSPGTADSSTLPNSGPVPEVLLTPLRGRPRKPTGQQSPAIQRLIKVWEDLDKRELTSSEIAKELAVSRHAANVRLQNACKQNLIERTGRGRYALITPPESQEKAP